MTDPVSLADSAADLHVEEQGWLPSAENADRILWFLLGAMAGGTAFSVALAASAAAAVACTSVLLVVWVVAFLVWFLWA